MLKKKLFRYYIFIGILYILVKAIFISFGLLRQQAIIHGLIPCILTTTAGLVCMRKVAEGSNKSICKWTLILLPVLVLLTTPFYMYRQMGDQWLSNGRLSALIIYEVLALVQIFLAGKISKETG